MPEIDMTGVRIDRDYIYDGKHGCERCQDGAHWECHGCSCPCSYNPAYEGITDPEEIQGWKDSVNAIRPRITVEQREEQWRLRELKDTEALVESESARGML